MNEVLERCGGLDVHKKTVTICIMVGVGKKMLKEIRTFETTTPKLYELAKWLKSYDIKEVAMESTGIYWKPVYNVLEKDFRVMLTNPWHMKNIPGKKTDVKDAEWICRLLKHGLLKGSFIPPKKIRELRELTRLRKKSVQSRNRAYNRIIKSLESCNIKLKSVVSRIDGTSAWNIVKAISEGKTDPKELADLVTTNIRASNEEVMAALTGFIGEFDVTIIRLKIQEVDFFEKLISDIDLKIKDAEKAFESRLEILKSFPGIGEITGVTVISEIGINMDQFPTSDQLTSWAGLAPGNNESAGKKKSTRISTGNINLKTSLLQSAWSAIRQKNGYWQVMFYRLKARLGAKKAIIAIARRILKVIYLALKFGMKYENLNLKDDPNRINKAIQYHTKKLEELSKKASPAIAA